MRRKEENIFVEKSHRGRNTAIFLLLVLVLLLAAGAVGSFAVSNTVQSQKESVTIPDIPNALDQWSILLLSDLNGEYRGISQASIGKAVGEKAVSSVVLAGNMVGEKGDPQPVLDLLEQLPLGAPVMLLPGGSDPLLYATTAHASLSPYADWAQTLINAGVTILDVPVSFTREKATIWFIPEDIYTMDIASTRKAYQKQLDGLNELPSLTADQQALKRLAIYQLERMTRIEEAAASIKAADIQVCVSSMPLSQESISTMKRYANTTSLMNMNNVDVIVSGGYCGGQWRIPGIGALYVPELGWFPNDAQVQGLSFQSGIWQYISPGLGSGAYYPWWMGFRVFNSPAVTTLSLTKDLS